MLAGTALSVPAAPAARVSSMAAESRSAAATAGAAAAVVPPAAAAVATIGAAPTAGATAAAAAAVAAPAAFAAAATTAGAFAATAVTSEAAVAAGPARQGGRRPTARPRFADPGARRDLPRRRVGHRVRRQLEQLRRVRRVPAAWTDGWLFLLGCLLRTRHRANLAVER